MKIIIQLEQERLYQKPKYKPTEQQLINLIPVLNSAEKLLLSTD